MKMVLQSVSLCDDITIKSTDARGIRLSTNLGYLPVNKANIAYRAALMFYDSLSDSDYGIEIRLDKKIPVCAGMGGGSADGAAVLRALNRMHGFPLKREELLAICRKLGSDVAFCLEGGTALATGRGDVLTELPALASCHIVVCKPLFSVSTPELFKCINVKKIRLRPDTEELIKYIERCDAVSAARRMYNVFEDVLPKGRETIDDIKGILAENGAAGAAMTGTGSAVFGIFDDRCTANKAYAALKNKYGEVFFAVPVSKIDLNV